MTAMTNALEAALLALIFQNANIANIGDATGLRGSTTPGVFYISAHTADPGEAGDQTSNEISYTGYARISVVRSGSGWSISGSTASNAADILFGLCTGGSGTITHIGIGTSLSGSGFLLLKGPLSSSIAVSNNIQPRVPATELDILMD